MKKQIRHHLVEKDDSTPTLFLELPKTHTPVFGDQNQALDILPHSWKWPLKQTIHWTLCWGPRSHPCLVPDSDWHPGHPLSLNKPCWSGIQCLHSFWLYPPIPPLHHLSGCPPCMDPPDSSFQVLPISRSFPGHLLLSSIPSVICTPLLNQWGSTSLCFSYSMTTDCIIQGKREEDSQAGAASIFPCLCCPFLCFTCVSKVYVQEYLPLPKVADNCWLTIS